MEQEAGKAGRFEVFPSVNLSKTARRFASGSQQIEANLPEVVLE
jgi:hypothetical protein